MEQLKKQSRDLQNKIEKKLQEFDQLSVAIDPNCLQVQDDPRLPEEKLQILLQRLLDQLSNTLDEMKEIARNNLQQSLIQNLYQHFKDLSFRYKETWKRIQNKRKQQQLFGNHLSQIELSQTDILIKEGESLDNSLNMARDITDALEQASKSMKYQHQRLSSTGDKLVQFAQTLPGVNLLLGRISRRKRLNTIVIGLTIAVCTLLLLTYCVYV